MIRAAVLLLLAAGCAPGFSMTRERQLACNEACARAAGELGLNATSAWSDGDADCACTFDDGTTALTCRRPMLGGGCP